MLRTAYTAVEISAVSFDGREDEIAPRHRLPADREAHVGLSGTDLRLELGTVPRRRSYLRQGESSASPLADVLGGVLCAAPPDRGFPERQQTPPQETLDAAELHYRCSLKHNSERASPKCSGASPPYRR